MNSEFLDIRISREAWEALLTRALCPKSLKEEECIGPLVATDIEKLVVSLESSSLAVSRLFIQHEPDYAEFKLRSLKK